MTVSYLLFMGIGKVMIYLGMKFPLFTESRYEFVRRLFSCDECLGCYLYTGLAFSMGIDLFSDFQLSEYSVVTKVITGLVSSFIAHIFSIGWKSKFEVLIIE